MNSLTRRYLDEVGRDPAVTRLVMDRLLASPVLHAVPNCGRLLSRPMFIEEEDRRQVESDLARIYDLLASLPRRLFDGDLRRYARAIGLGPAQTELAVRLAAPWPPPLLARPDLYRDESGFKLLELNLGSNLGGYQTAAMNRAFLQVDAVRAFVDRERLRYVDTMEVAAAMLRRAHHGGSGASRPVIALADWPASYPKFESMLHFMAVQLEEMGFDARPCHLGQLREDGSSLALDGTRVDIVFRYFTMAEITGEPEGCALVEHVIRAHERGDVDMFVPLSTSLLGSKQALALLCDEGYRDAFSPAELALIDRFVPWTRELKAGHVHVDGVEVELLDFCRGAKDRLVLKPSHLLGGVGVQAGWTMSEGEWRARLDDARNGSFVVQERVVPEVEPCPDRSTGALRPWIMNWGIFVTDRGYSGCFLRGSSRLDDGVVNFDNRAWVGASFHQAP
jgi:hypothetical protein